MMSVLFCGRGTCSNHTTCDTIERPRGNNNGGREEGQGFNSVIFPREIFMADVRRAQEPHALYQKFCVARVSHMTHIVALFKIPQKPHSSEGVHFWQIR
jgi:hypothetical protein